MLNQIDPHTVYIVHKEKERELEARIAMVRAAKENATISETSQPWYAPIMLWMKTKLFHRAPAAQQVQEPCPTVPC